MTEKGWRVLIIEENNSMFLREGMIVVENGEKTKEFPLNQISVIIIEKNNRVISVPLLSAIIANSIRLVICDDKHTPSGELMPYCSNSQASGRLMKQINWKDEVKNDIWRNVVKDKIRQQANLLEEFNLDGYNIVEKYFEDVRSGDIDNREAQAARIYFVSLFGKDFNRSIDNNINHALNYGYSILLSSVSRFISIYGYNSSLGIHHHSSENPFNLSSDLMEPFRPFIDKFVYLNRNRFFDLEYKKDLASLLYKVIDFKSKRTTLINAIEEYVNEIIKQLSKEEYEERLIGA